MGYTTGQFISFVRRTITDALNRQNTAAVVRSVFERIGVDYFNKASDTLPISGVAGLQDALDANDTTNLSVRVSTLEDRADDNDTRVGHVEDRATALELRATADENRLTATEGVANAQKSRLDALVANADPALDVLKEIGDQLRADEAGTAAILATQQQQGTQISSNTTAIGMLSALTTTAKNNLVAAINELVTRLNLKAPIASPTFTGIASGATAAQGTNTTQLATTAFVQGEKGVRKVVAVASWNGNTPGALDAIGVPGYLLTSAASAGTPTLRIPPDAYFAAVDVVPPVGTWFHIRQLSAIPLQVVAYNGYGGSYGVATVNTRNTTLSTTSQGQTLRIEKTANNTWLVTPAEGELGSADTFIGLWNPATNTPLLRAATGTKGSYYRLSADSPPSRTTTISQYFPNDTILAVANGSGVVVDMLATWSGSPAGVRVIGVSGNSIEVNQLVTVPLNTAVTFTFNFAGVSSISAGQFVYYNGAAWEVRQLTAVPRINLAEQARIVALFTSDSQFSAYDSSYSAGAAPYGATFFNFSDGDRYELVQNLNDLDGSGSGKPYWTRV